MRANGEAELAIEPVEPGGLKESRIELQLIARDGQQLELVDLVGGCFQVEFVSLKPLLSDGPRVFEWSAGMRLIYVGPKP